MDPLFSSGDLNASLQGTRAEMLTEVERWDAEQMLTQSETEIVDYLCTKYSVDCPTLLRDEWFADEPTDAKTRVRDFGETYEVAVTRLRIHVPYSGERVFFTQRPRSFTLNPPQAAVGNDEIVLTFEHRQLDAERVRSQLDHEVAEIGRWLAWSRAMAQEHNDSLEATALRAVQERKAKLLRDRKAVAALGIPVRRRDDAPSYAIPVARRRADVARPPSTTSSRYQPEPALSDADYEEALRVITNACRQLERSPSTAKRLDEEERRDLLLVALNAQFEGQAGGEVFNGAGKTDILLRVDDRNVFIAECKIWRGTKGFGEAIDQLLGYLVWRDTKAALIVFIESKGASAVIEKSAQALATHAQCVRALPPTRPEERQDFVLLAERDPAREIRVALVPVVIDASS